MFKPGTRVQKVTTIGLSAQAAVGDLGTVLDLPVPEFVAHGDNKHDVIIRLDDGREVSAQSRLWRPLDQNKPSKLSIQDMLKTPLKETA